MSLPFPLRIGFDAKRAFYNPSGLGNYSRNSIRILTRYFPANNYFLFTPGRNNALLFEEPEKCLICKPTGIIQKMLPALWRSFGISNDIYRNRINLYHGLSNELPAGINKSGARSVVTIHDLIFLRHPEFYRPIDRLIYKRKFSFSARIADTVIAVSEQTKNEIVELLNIDKHKVKVVYQGCNEAFRRKVKPEVKAKVASRYELPSAYALCVGTIEKRKNQLSIVKAIHEGNINIPLVCIGKATPYMEEIRKYMQNQSVKNIIFLHDVDSNDLPAIYQKASVFIYPSLIEGFGIPVLEAITSGIPAVVSKIGCLTETGGEGAFYINPLDVEEIADALNKALLDSGLRTQLINGGRKHAEKFTDETISTNLMDLYQSLF